MSERTPSELASELGVTGLRIRNWLREHYPRSPAEKQARWILDAEQVAGIRARFGPGSSLPSKPAQPAAGPSPARKGRSREPSEREPPRGRGGRDEDYVIDLCDQLLGESALRQHRFDWPRLKEGPVRVHEKPSCPAYTQEMVQMVKAFFIVASSTGLNRRTGPRFWPLLLKVLFTKPRAIEVVVGQSAMHTNYYNRSRSYIAALLEEIELVEKVGEATFNEQRLLPPEATVREMTSTARKPRGSAAAPAS